MEINFIDENKKEIWNEFVVENNGSFLQSFEWGEFQKQFLQKVWRIRVNKNGREFLQAQIIKEKIFPITYFYIPYGPVFNEHSLLREREESFNLFLREIGKLAKKERALFLRIEPIVSLPKIENFYFRDSLKRNQPQRTLTLNLEKSENDLLENMRGKTRYNIGLAQRRGVEIKRSDDYSDIFYHLIRKTRERQGFSSYTEEHYKKIFKISNDFKVKMFLAEYQEKVIVASIVVFFGDRVISLHTGSDYECRALKGADLLRWNVILYAKKMGYKIYDFWGIDEKKFPGVTNFKKGFGGEAAEYPFGVDIIFNNTWYQIYTMMKKIKRIF